MIADRLAQVRRRVAQAATDAGRDPADVRLLLATKTQTAERVREALDADARARADDPALTAVLVGENRVQELVAKGPELDGLASLHLIGPLQSNKVNAALRWASCIESVASLDLAQRLSARTDADAGRLRPGQRVRRGDQARRRSRRTRSSWRSRPPACPGCGCRG